MRPGREGVDQLQALLANAPPGLVVVLDDVHELAPAAMRHVLSPLVRFAPDSARLVLVSRYDPPALPVNKLRLQGELGELREGALAFTAQEVSALATAMDQRMDLAAAEELRTLTDGWAVAVRLALMSLRDSVDHSAQFRLIRTLDVPVNEYLVEEVLSQLEPRVADFVLSATVSDRITPGLAEHLVPGGAQLLEHCVVHGLFLTGPASVGTEPSYRWNPLFAAQCRSVAARRSPGMPAALHRKAAHYLHRREAADAFAHAVQAGDHHLSVRILADVWPDMLVLGAPDLIRAMCRQLPPPHDRHAEVRLALAAASAVEGAAELDLPTAEPSTREDARERRRLMLALVGVLVAEGHVGCDGRRADRDGLLAPVSSARPATRAVGLFVLGRDRLGRPFDGGQFDGQQGMDLLDDAIRCARVAGLHGTEVACRAQQSLALLRRGEVREADQHAALAIGQASLRGWERAAALSTAYLVRGLVAHWQDRRTEAQSFLERAVDLPGPGYSEVRGYAALCLAMVQLARGDLAQARRTQAREDVLHPTARTSPEWGDLRDVVRAMTLQAEGDPAGALAVARSGPSDRHPLGMLWESSLLRRCGDRAGAWAALKRLPGSARNGYVGVDARLHEALLHADEGEIGATHAAIEQALAAADAGLIVRPFHEHTLALRPLLVEHLGWGTCHADLIRRVLAAHDGISRPPATSELTARETEVLACLRSSMSTAEIATSLFLSVNTVKTHQRAIYRKLGAEGRRAAVRRGLDLGLI